MPKLSLVPKMADSPAQVTRLPARPGARAPARMPSATSPNCASSPRTNSACRPAGLGPPFASEQLKEARYAFSEHEVKQYFTEPRVLEGLFRLIETLFEVRIREDHGAGLARRRALLPHRTTGTASRPTGRPVLPRPATPGRQAARRLDGRARAAAGSGPTARPADAGGEPRLQLRAAGRTASPALLTHDDVITLFHEFGHGLHHMLTRVDELGVAGITVSSGTPSSCPASSWRTSAGSGTCSRA